MYSKDPARQRTSFDILTMMAMHDRQFCRKLLKYCSSETADLIHPLLFPERSDKPVNETKSFAASKSALFISCMITFEDTKVRSVDTHTHVQREH
jgi:hypothetical protein